MSQLHCTENVSDLSNLLSGIRSGSVRLTCTIFIESVREFNDWNIFPVHFFSFHLVVVGVGGDAAAHASNQSCKRCNYSNDVYPYLFVPNVKDVRYTLSLSLRQMHIGRRHFIWCFIFLMRFCVCKSMRLKRLPNENVNKCLFWVHMKSIYRSLRLLILTPLSYIHDIRKFPYKCTTNACIRLDETNTRMNDRKCM